MIAAGKKAHATCGFADNGRMNEPLQTEFSGMSPQRPPDASRWVWRSIAAIVAVPLVAIIALVAWAVLSTVPDLFSRDSDARPKKVQVSQLKPDLADAARAGNAYLEARKQGQARDVCSMMSESALNKLGGSSSCVTSMDTKIPPSTQITVVRRVDRSRIALGITDLNASSDRSSDPMVGFGDVVGGTMGDVADETDSDCVITTCGFAEADTTLIMTSTNNGYRIDQLIP